MKTCIKCEQSKSLTDFHKRRDAKDGLQKVCKECNKKRALAHYHEDRNHAKALCKERASVKKAILASKVNAHKREKGCYFCGEKEPVCLDFHHLDPSQKDKSIAHLISVKSESRLWQEVSKCVVVCSNCHRNLHAGLLQVGPERIELSFMSG